MASPKFDVGDKVVLVGRLRARLGEGVYFIVRILPFDRGEPHYHLKSIDDMSECAVDGRDITRPRWSTHDEKGMIA